MKRRKPYPQLTRKLWERPREVLRDQLEPQISMVTALVIRRKLHHSAYMELHVQLASELYLETKKEMKNG